MNFEKQYFEQSDVWNVYFDNIEEDERVKITSDQFPEGIDSIVDIGCLCGHSDKSYQ